MEKYWFFQHFLMDKESYKEPACITQILCTEVNCLINFRQWVLFFEVEHDKIQCVFYVTINRIEDFF